MSISDNRKLMLEQIKRLRGQLNEVSDNLLKDKVMIDVNKLVSRYSYMKNRLPKGGTMQLVIRKSNKKGKNQDPYDMYLVGQGMDVLFGSTPTLKVSDEISSFAVNESVNEAVDDNANDFAKELERVVQRHFPKSMVHARFKTNIKPSVTLWFTIGKDSSEYSNGIYDNDPVLQAFIIWGFDDDGNVHDKVRVEQIRGWGFSIKPQKNKYLASELYKVALRKSTTTPSKAIAKIDKYFAKLKSELKNNVHLMHDKYQALVKSKL